MIKKSKSIIDRSKVKIGFDFWVIRNLYELVDYAYKNLQEEPHSIKNDTMMESVRYIKSSIKEALQKNKSSNIKQDENLIDLLNEELNDKDKIPQDKNVYKELLNKRIKTCKYIQKLSKSGNGIFYNWSLSCLQDDLREALKPPHQEEIAQFIFDTLSKEKLESEKELAKLER